MGGRERGGEDAKTMVEVELGQSRLVRRKGDRVVECVRYAQQRDSGLFSLPLRLNAKPSCLPSGKQVTGQALACR